MHTQAAALIVAMLCGTAAHAESNRTRLSGLRSGAHAVGFEFRTVIDPTRHVVSTGSGTPVGVAVWYPAEAAPTGRAHLTTLDYRLLQFAEVPTDRERETFEADEAAALPAWRHIGVVEMTDSQAVASLRTGGIAVRGAAPRAGRYPIVVVLGGAYYLSTTAEWLASQGFLVVAPVRFADRINEVGTSEFSWYLENSVRDAEFVLSTMQDDPHADMRSVAAIGHGGGGIQAMLLAMRNRQVRALVSIDSGSFSTRSGARDLPFYSPRLLRVPYLYLATAATRASQDQFEDFEAMAFSARHEVIVQNADIRHHDLSDLGRAVTEPLRIRGAAQSAVEQVYADMHEMIGRFLHDQAGTAATGPDGFESWIAARRASGTYTFRTYPRAEAAPTVVEIEQTLGEHTPSLLREARARDRDAPLFQQANLLRIAKKALASGTFAIAAAVADYAATLHPAAPQLVEVESDALERSGAFAAARAEATACAALPTANDWRAALAVRLCTDRLRRLAVAPGAGG